MSVCVAIPTFNREQVLLDTIRQVLAQQPSADEVLVIDQTPRHAPATSEALTAWQREGRIQWIRCSPPNASAARNRALVEAVSDIVIFIDDDVILPPGFLESHRACYDDPSVEMVAGQVLARTGRSTAGKSKTSTWASPLTMTNGRGLGPGAPAIAAFAAGSLSSWADSTSATFTAPRGRSRTWWRAPRRIPGERSFSSPRRAWFT